MGLASVEPFQPNPRMVNFEKPQGRFSNFTCVCVSGVRSQVRRRSPLQSPPVPIHPSAHPLARRYSLFFFFSRLCLSVVGYSSRWILGFLRFRFYGLLKFEGFAFIWGSYATWLHQDISDFFFFILFFFPALNSDICLILFHLVVVFVYKVFSCKLKLIMN